MSYNEKIMEAYAKMFLDGSAFKKETPLNERKRMIRLIFGDSVNILKEKEEFIKEEDFSV